MWRELNLQIKTSYHIVPGKTVEYNQLSTVNIKALVVGGGRLWPCTLMQFLYKIGMDWYGFYVIHIFILEVITISK